MAKMTCVASRMLLAEPTGWNLPTVNLALAKLVEVGAIKEGDRPSGRRVSLDITTTPTVLNRKRRESTNT